MDISVYHRDTLRFIRREPAQRCDICVDHFAETLEDLLVYCKRKDEHPWLCDACARNWNVIW